MGQPAVATTIYVDADACPVKWEICKVAKRHHIEVVFVANCRMRLPDLGTARLVIVGDGFNAADDWIAGHVSTNDVVITADIALAHGCIGNGARVIGPTGRPFTDENIGQAMAMRDLLADLREAGNVTGGTSPFGKKDRSRFLHCLDQVIQQIIREFGTISLL